MKLEACAAMNAEAPGLPFLPDESQLLRIDWAPLIASLCNGQRPAAQRAGEVHVALAETIVNCALTMRERESFEVVGLTGGVFQNRKLTELAADRLERAGFRVWLHARVPCNDGGLALGQVAEAVTRAARQVARA
jgi:hydrogenase maturation protein HypF